MPQLANREPCVPWECCYLLILGAGIVEFCRWAIPYHWVVEGQICIGGQLFAHHSNTAIHTEYRLSAARLHHSIPPNQNVPRVSPRAGRSRGMCCVSIPIAREVNKPVGVADFVRDVG